MLTREYIVYALDGKGNIFDVCGDEFESLDAAREYVRKQKEWDKENNDFCDHAIYIRMEARLE